MASPDPMEGGRTVRLFLHPAQVGYLRECLENFVAGLESDITGHPEDEHVDAWKGERDVYLRLSEGLERGQVISVDGETERLIGHWLASSDRSEEFHRVLFEHQAVASLREQIEPGR